MNQTRTWLLFFLVFLGHISLSAETVDPFIWLEEDPSEKVNEWVQDQQKKTENYFKATTQKERLKQSLEGCFHDSFTLPEIRKNGHFFMKLGKDEDKASICFMPIDQKERILIAPPQEVGAAFTHFSVSQDGKKLTYGISYGGTDSEIWYTFDVEKETPLADTFDGIKFSYPVWSKNGTSLFYVKDGHRLYQHHMNTLQSEDRLLFQTNGMQDALLQLLDITESNNYLVIATYTPEDKDNTVLLWDLFNQKIVECIPPRFGVNQYVGELEDELLFITDHDSSFRRLISINPKNPSEWTTLIQEKNQILDSAGIADHKIVTVFYEAAVAKLKVYSSEGTLLQEIPLPGMGSASISTHPKFYHFFYSYTDFYRPNFICHVDIKTDEQTIFFQPQLSLGQENFVTRQVWFQNRDGLKIPLFLTHKKDLIIDESTPVLLYGYGGFGLSVTPHFSSFSVVWMQEGGIYAVASLRGGFEFGKEWHEAGRLHNKKNVFHDFIDAAEWLISKKIGSAQTLAIRGQSNGGLLTAACLTMRPELFGAVIVDKGVLDMLRFHLFTVGYMWKSDYGDPETPEDYAYLLSYSPYHNIKAKTEYPSTLIMTADHDDRVVPSHSYKFTAALQGAQNGANPIILRVEKSEGHKRGSSRRAALSSHLDMLLFLKKEMHFN